MYNILFEINIEETLNTFVIHCIYLYRYTYRLMFSLMNCPFRCYLDSPLSLLFLFFIPTSFWRLISGTGNAGCDRSTRKRRGSRLFVCHGAASSGTRCVYIDKLLLCDSRFLASNESTRHLLPCSFICKPMPLMRQTK